MVRARGLGFRVDNLGSPLGGLAGGRFGWKPNLTSIDPLLRSESYTNHGTRRARKMGVRVPECGEGRRTNNSGNTQSADGGSDGM